jgi:CAAX prenyl protease-like protein
VVSGLAVLALARRELPAPRIALGWTPVVIAAAVAAAWLLAPAAAAAPLASAFAGLEPAERWAWLATRLAGGCVLVPVVEELAFRGFLLRWLVSPDFERVPPRTWTWPAVVGSSMAFGALHESWLLGTFAGLLFAAARLWRGRLSDAILAHVLANVAIAAAVLVLGRWDLWGG